MHGKQESILPLKNKQYLVVKHLIGSTPFKECLNLTETEIKKIDHDEILIENIFLSVDPAMIGWLRPVKSYIEPVSVGKPMRGIGIGKVVISNCDSLKPGTFVSGNLGLQQYLVISSNTAQSSLQVIPNPDPSFLSVLGHTGFTAYLGLIVVGKPQKGETVLVSAAAGAVGQIVCQIAKHCGCRVVAIAGTDEKCQNLTSFYGVDSTINYKGLNRSQLVKQIANSCPNGVDVYFDNVGGDMLEAALENINQRARVVICGAISVYKTGPKYGPRNYLQLLIKNARMEGFNINDSHMKSYYKEFLSFVSPLVQQGKLKHKETFEHGIENAMKAIDALFQGTNEGKQLIQLTEPKSKL